MKLLINEKIFLFLTFLKNRLKISEIFSIFNFFEASFFNVLSISLVNDYK